LPSDLVPTIVARLLALRAPAKISLALADLPLMITAIGMSSGTSSSGRGTGKADENPLHKAHEEDHGATWSEPMQRTSDAFLNNV
jgi:hypothetical protein